MKHDGTPPPSSTSSLERKSSGLPALRQHRSIHGSGDNTSQIQIWTHPALPLQVRNQVRRFMPEAHRRQAESTWRPKTPRRRRRSLHSAIEIACRGHRKLLELMAIRPRRGWVEQRAAAQERGVRSIADATSCRPGPHGPVRSGGERRNMRRYGTPSRKNAPFPPASIAGHTRPRFAAGRSMLRISTRPLPYRSRVGTGC